MPFRYFIDLLAVCRYIAGPGWSVYRGGSLSLALSLAQRPACLLFCAYLILQRGGGTGKHSHVRDIDFLADRKGRINLVWILRRQ